MPRSTAACPAANSAFAVAQQVLEEDVAAQQRRSPTRRSRSRRRGGSRRGPCRRLSLRIGVGLAPVLLRAANPRLGRRWVSSVIASPGREHRVAVRTRRRTVSSPAGSPGGRPPRWRCCGASRTRGPLGVGGHLAAPGVRVRAREAARVRHPARRSPCGSNRIGPVAAAAAPARLSKTGLRARQKNSVHVVVPWPTQSVRRVARRHRRPVRERVAVAAPSRAAHQPPRWTLVDRIEVADPDPLAVDVVDVGAVGVRVDRTSAARRRSARAAVRRVPQVRRWRRRPARRAGCRRVPDPLVAGSAATRRGPRREDAADVAPAAAYLDRDRAPPAPARRARRVERRAGHAPPRRGSAARAGPSPQARGTPRAPSPGCRSAAPESARARLVAGDINEDRVAVVDRHHAPGPDLAGRLVAGHQARAGGGGGLAGQARREGEREHGAEQSAHLQWNTAHRREVRCHRRNSAPGNVGNRGIKGEGRLGALVT